jgi:large subunit ribosomal protein L21
MNTLAVIKTGGKQYLVKEGDLITVDKIEAKEKEKVNLETLMIFDEQGNNLDLGTPTLTKKVEAEVVSHTKGEKIRVARFKAKVRYRRVKGFRPLLTTLRIVKI